MTQENLLEIAENLDEAFDRISQLEAEPKLPIAGAIPPHDILSVSHSDTVANAVTRGSLMYGDATPDWNELVIGAVSTHLESDGVDVAWQVNLTMADGATVGQAAGALLTFDDAGNTLGIDLAAARDFTFSANLFAFTAGSNMNVNTGIVFMDTDADSFFWSNADDTIVVGLNSGIDFSFTINAFNVLTGSAIVMADDTTIGQAAGPLLTFDDAGNVLRLTGGDLHLNNGAEDKLKLRRSGDVAATESDIYGDEQLGLAADTNVHIFIDALNSGADDYFAIQKDAENVAGATELVRVTEAPIMFLNDTANGNMAIGLTINQAANDNEALGIQSTDVGTVFNAADANTFFAVRKVDAAGGGALIRGLRDPDGDNSQALVLQGLLDEDTNTTKTQAGRAITEIQGFQTDGTNLENTVANGNVVAVRTRRGGSVVTLFIVDEDGDLFADGGVGSTNMVTLFDEYNDAELVRAFDVARGPEQVIRSEWDKYVRYNEDTLVKAGVLGGRLSDGGLTNVTRLQQLHNGAIWQNYTYIKQLETALIEAGIDVPRLEAG